MQPELQISYLDLRMLSSNNKQILVQTHVQIRVCDKSKKTMYVATPDLTDLALFYRKSWATIC